MQRILQSIIPWFKGDAWVPPFSLRMSLKDRRLTICPSIYYTYFHCDCCWNNVNFASTFCHENWLPRLSRVNCFPTRLRSFFIGKGTTYPDPRRMPIKALSVLEGSQEAILVSHRKNQGDNASSFISTSKADENKCILLWINRNYLLVHFRQLKTLTSLWIWLARVASLHIRSFIRGAFHHGGRDLRWPEKARRGWHVFQRSTLNVIDGNNNISPHQ